MNTRALLPVMAGAACSLLSVVALAADKPAAKPVKPLLAEERPAAAADAPQAVADMRAALSGVMQPEAITSVTKTPYGDFFEVVMKNGDIIYVDKSAGFMFAGPLIDVKARKNVTQERVAQLNRINFADLPLSQAIRVVRGNGKRVLATFEDPNCGYCKKLAKDLQEIKDATVYTFMVPILSPDSADKSRNIWCAKDRAKAWNDWMTEGKAPANAECDTPLAKNRELADKLRVTGTPTMYLADGNRIGGYVALSELEKMMAGAEKGRK